MQPRVIAVAVPVLVIACAHSPARTQAAPGWAIANASTVDTFEIGATPHDWAVKVNEEQILGVQPDLGLVRSEGEIKGRALGVQMVVGFHGDQGAGVYRGAPFEVFVVHTPKGLEVTGTFAGTMSDFELSPARIRGQVGICAYDLHWNGKVYLGYRGCGDKVEAMSVSLPAALARWSDVEVAGALGLLLNVGGPIRLDPLADNSARYRNAPVPDPALASYYELAADARTGTRKLMGDKPHDWRRELLSSGATWEAPGLWR